MKIAVIGAGSSRLPLMLASLASAKPDEIALYDIKFERIRRLLPVALFFLREASLDVRVRICENPEDAIRDSSFIILTARPGFEEARAKDERICLWIGVLPQETTGACGFSFALRSVPVAIEYAKLVLRFAKDSRLFVFMNPAGLITQAICEVTGLDALGICDSADVAIKAIARKNAVSVDECDFIVRGLNHLSWTYSVSWKGKDLLQDALKDRSFLASSFPWLSPEAIQRLQRIPNEYLRYFYLHESELKKIRDRGMTRGEQILRWNKAMFDDVESLVGSGQEALAFERYLRYIEERNGVTNPNGSAMERFLTQVGGYAEVVSTLIRPSQKQKKVVLNARAGEAIEGLLPSDVVECEGIWQDNSFIPPKPLRLPDEDANLVFRIKEYERLTIKAALTGKREVAIKALSSHPLIQTFDLAERLLGALKPPLGC
jgi:6-phospho-beta-glucosidase